MLPNTGAEDKICCGSGEGTREVSKTCWMFLVRDKSVIACKITWGRQRSVLLEGGLQWRGEKTLIDELDDILINTYLHNNITHELHIHGNHMIID